MDAAAVHRQEQELLACAESLRSAKRKAELLKSGVHQAWRSEETAYLSAAIDKVIAELDQEIRRTEQLAEEISTACTRLRVEAELLGKIYFWRMGRDCFKKQKGGVAQWRG